MRTGNRVIALCLTAALFFAGLPAANAAGSRTFYCDEVKYTSAESSGVSIRPDFYSTLSPASRAVYDVLVDNLVLLRDGKSELVFYFPDSVSYDDLSTTMYQDAMNAFNRDHSEAFWLDMAAMKLTVSQMSDGRLKGTIAPVEETYYTAAYTSAEEVERDAALMEARIDELASAAARFATIYERVLYIHDWLTEHNACSEDGINSHMRAFEAVSALEGNLTGAYRPVCEGYARAFKLLCDELGVPCMLITGEGLSGDRKESHMWNYVRLDGAWYAVDVTWDDPIYLEDEGKPRHTYFLIGCETLCDEGMAFSENHVEIKKLSTHGSDIAYPALAKDLFQPVQEVSSGSLKAFSYARTYESGLFTDVKKNEWYETGVASAYRLGLMSGTGDGRFNVTGLVTAAEALTMAVRIHAAYYGNEIEPLWDGGRWYEPYVEYAFAHNMLRRQYPDYTAPLTRAEFSVLFAQTMPEEEFAAIRTIPDDSVADIPSGAGYAGAAYLLYRAGVLLGNEHSEFQPDKNISRAEVALIVTRIVDKTLRAAQ